MVYILNLFLNLILFIFGQHCAAHGILSPRLAIKPVTPEVGMWSPNHWTTREFPKGFFVFCFLFFFKNFMFYICLCWVFIVVQAFL